VKGRDFLCEEIMVDRWNLTLKSRKIQGKKPMVKEDRIYFVTLLQLSGNGTTKR